MTAAQKSAKYVLTLMFFSLLIDLFAFTLILPIYPAMIDYYITTDTSSTVLKQILELIVYFEEFLGTKINMTSTKLRVTLLGGLLGSTFSLCQFLVAPFWGRLGDKFGRRTVLLISIIGNLASNVLWMISKNFNFFVLSRLIGGLTEANVQLTNAIISDVTDSKTRSKGMALVGIAFSIAFTLGPSICGYLIFKGVRVPQLDLLGFETPYSAAGLLASILIVVEFILLAMLLPETLNFKKSATQDSKEDESLKIKESDKPKDDLSSNIQQLNVVHLFYLFLFSGMEFTLPFLAHDLFKFNEMEQGKMFGLMGTISSLIQGGYVRRFASKKGEKKLVLEGLLCGVLGLLSLAVFIPTQIKPSNWVIWTAIIFLSYTSATVISCLTALLSLVADSCHKHYQTKATVLGNFRSYGQLGRCLGPVIACSIYWLFGPKILYYFGALGMALTYFVLFKMPNHIKKVTKTE